MFSTLCRNYVLLNSIIMQTENSSVLEFTEVLLMVGRAKAGFEVVMDQE